MLDEQDGHFKFVADVVDDLQQLLGLGGVHAGRRFVEEQQLHVGGQRAGDLQPALLTVGQVVGLQVLLAGEVDDFQQLLGAGGDLRLLLPVFLCAEDGVRHTVGRVLLHSGLNILDDCHLFEKADVLERPGDARLHDLVRFFAVHPLTAEVEGALGGLVDAGDEVKDCRLARAVGADEPDQLRLADLHVEVIHGLQAAELDAEMLCFQYGCCHNGFTLLSRPWPWVSRICLKHPPAGGSG